MTYKPKEYRGYTLHYMDGGRVQPLSVYDTRGYLFNSLSDALDWIDGESDIRIIFITVAHLNLIN